MVLFFAYQPRRASRTHNVMHTYSAGVASGRPAFRGRRRVSINREDIYEGNQRIAVVAGSLNGTRYEFELPLRTPEASQVAAVRQEDKSEPEKHANKAKLLLLARDTNAEACVTSTACFLGCHGSAGGIHCAGWSA